MTNIYYKEIDGEIIQFTGILYVDGKQIIHPTHEILIENGWTLKEPDINDAKEQKIRDILDYDSSNNVNEFYVNGMSGWFDKETRSNFRGSLNDAELLGETQVSVPINGHVVTLPIQNAKLFLAQIQRYADACTIVTTTHIEEVEALNTIEAVEAYDITVGYPTKLTFTI